jgi:hypothetical protein
MPRGPVPAQSQSEMATGATVEGSRTCSVPPGAHTATCPFQITAWSELKLPGSHSVFATPHDSPQEIESCRAFCFAVGRKRGPRFTTFAARSLIVTRNGPTGLLHINGRLLTIRADFVLPTTPQKDRPNVAGRLFSRVYNKSHDSPMPFAHCVDAIGSVRLSCAKKNFVIFSWPTAAQVLTR